MTDTRGATVAEAACAKINLSLHVTGKRPDGYHLLESIVVFCGVHDTILAEPGHGLSLRVTGPRAEGLSGEGDNIMLRAARALAELTGRAPDVRLTLIKRLPVASGIGGGSADAAATVRALLRLWGEAPPRDDLLRLALGLGADVPVCLEGKAVVMRGIGEDLQPLPALPPDLWMVLANPLRPVSTAAVFRALAGHYRSPAPAPGPLDTAGKLVTELGTWQNDLENPARTLEPSVSGVLDGLAATDGVMLARMSGSGATCFGLYASQDEAQKAARALRDANPGWWIAAGPVLADTTRQPPAQDGLPV